ncbi:MAG: preprotein translocase subunit SecG [Gammaproteobacteria bacterium]|jgi:preprotein translocase subunit SecG
MANVLLVVQVLAACGLIALVLLQHGKGADAGAAFGSGASGSLFGSRGPTSFLSRSTAILAIVFFANSLVLSYLAGHSRTPSSVVEQFQEKERRSQPVSPPSSSDVPSLPGSAEPAELPRPEPVEGQRADVPQVPETPTSKSE